ncbi:hypothetical protein EJB05_33006, partial [Eragrostis curvula]
MWMNSSEHFTNSLQARGNILEEAFEVKDTMAQRFNLMPNAHVYTSLMKGLCERGDVDAAVRLKEEIAGKADLVLDSAVYATLVCELFRVRRKSEVVGLLEEMKGREIVADTVVYNAIIAVFCEDDKDPSAAFAVLEDMKKCGCKGVGVNTGFRLKNQGWKHLTHSKENKLGTQHVLQGLDLKSTPMKTARLFHPYLIPDTDTWYFLIPSSTGPRQGISCSIESNHFSRLRAITFQGMVMEEAMVSASHGAMGSLLGKLGELLTDKYKLFKEAKMEIRSLQSELQNMQAFLKDMSGTQNPSEQTKCWMSEVRELSYDIDDSVDEFMLRLEQESSSKPQGFRGFIERCLSLLTTVKARHQITKEFRGLKRLAEEVSERHKRYKVDDATSKQHDETIDPRMLALYTETARLVGIDRPRDELIQLMNEDDVSSQYLKVIAIFGFGGLGKTTLANEIFRKLEGEYHCRGFVVVSQKPNIWKILRKILSQVGYAAPENTDMEIWDVDDLVNALRNFLTGKRYFIVIDDIWNATTWTVISCAFPDNKNGSRVIATTRIETVATACCSNQYQYVYKMKALGTEDSRRLFFKRVFGSDDTCPSYLEEVSNIILKRCGGLPLAIITVSSHLATQGNKLNKEQWEETLDSLGSNLELNPTLEGMRQVLNLSYTSLPHCLKTCVLYLGMYPEDHTISKNDLVRQWVAQGFVSKAIGRDPEDIALGYFNEIVNRSIVQPAYTDSNDDVLSCRVHDMMLDLIIHKCREENFMTATDDIEEISGMLKNVRRLSLYSNGVIDGKSHGSIQLSHVRAFTRFGTSTYIPPLVEFKHLRVLNLEFSARNRGQIPIDLTGISCLFQLRYLKVVTWNQIELPSKISRFQQLETLEIDASKVEIPSDIAHLRRLLHLIIDGGLSLPKGIGNMKSLRTFRFSLLFMSSTDTIIEIGDLTNLRDLQLRFYRQRQSGDEAARQLMHALRSSLEKLCNLRYLRIRHDGCLDELSSLSTTPLLLRKFVTQSGWHSRIPMWIGKLYNLYHLQLFVKEVLGHDIRILAQLPSLTSLHMTIRATPKENMVICRTGFSVLKHLDIGCSRMSRLIFESGAMPKLQMLEIHFNASGWDRHGAAPTGMEHLSSLKEISVQIGGRGAKESSREAAQSMLRKAIDLHPGRPMAKIRCIDGLCIEFDDFVMEEVQSPLMLLWKCNHVVPLTHHINQESRDAPLNVADIRNQGLIVSTLWTWKSIYG